MTEVEKQNKQDKGVQNAEQMKLQDNQYGAYNLLKKELGIFTGLGATVVAVFSTMKDFCGYLYESSKLKYWGVDPVYIDINGASFLYGTIVTLGFFCVLCFGLFAVEFIAERTAMFSKKKKYLKFVEKLFKKNEGELLISQDHKDNAVHCDYVCTICKEIKTLKAAINRNRKTVRLQAFCHLLFLHMLLTAMLYVWFCAGGENYSLPMVILLIVSSFISVLLLSITYPMAKASMVNKKEIKKKSR